MKKIKILVFLLFLILFNSCQNDDIQTISKKETLNSEINGQWTLVNVSGGFAGTNMDFPAGWITWNFNESSATLTVVNNNLYANPMYDGLQTGTYTYSSFLTTTSCGNDFNPLAITNGFESCYTIMDDVLIIANNQIADGYILKFKRMMFCGTN